MFKHAVVKVTSHYSGLAARSSVKNDSSQMSKPTALSHCTMQSVAVGDETAGTSLAFPFISCVYAYLLLVRSMNGERNAITVVRRRYFFLQALMIDNCSEHYFVMIDRLFLYLLQVRLIVCYFSLCYCAMQT